MKKLIPIMTLGMVAVVTYDAVTAFIALSANFPYEWFSLGSFIIYAFFGFLGARRSKWFLGAVVGGFVGLADSTVGWAVSWNIGPGRPDIDMNLPLFAIAIAITIAIAVSLAAVLGLVGGALSLIGKPDA